MEADGKKKEAEGTREEKKKEEDEAEKQEGIGRRNIERKGRMKSGREGY